MTEKFNYRLMLAPLAGFTNAVFRQICAECGAEYTVSEMISAKAVCYNDKKTLLLSRNSSNIPMGLQLFGSEPEFIHRAIKILCSPQHLEANVSVMPAAIDINMGCPVHKIVSNGEGSALMRDSVRAAEIVRAAVEATELPVTVKIRAGYTKDSINADSFASVLEAAGASAVCVHGRTREQMYSGRVDLDIIRAVKEAVGITVIGNGDITSAANALDMMRYTGCDGVMIGRGAVGYPWIFDEIRHALDGIEYTNAPTAQTRAETAKRHVREMCALFGETRAVPEARKAVSAYFCDFRGAAAARAEINRAKTADEMCGIIDGVMNNG